MSRYTCSRLGGKLPLLFGSVAGGKVAAPGVHFPRRMVPARCAPGIAPLPADAASRYSRTIAGTHFALRLTTLAGWEQHFKKIDFPHQPRKLRPDGAGHDFHLQTPTVTSSNCAKKAVSTNPMLKAEPNPKLKASGGRFIIIASKYNARYVDSMVKSARSVLKRSRAQVM